MTGVLVAVLAISLVQAYFFVLIDGEICTVRPEVLRGGARSMWSVWTWTTQMLLFGAVPLACLFLNLMVIYQVISSRCAAGVLC